MKIIPLKKNAQVYSCNPYLILGDWNRIEDVNTVIDPGADGFVLEEIEHLSTGFGKVAVAQVILTHNHFDHNGGVMALKQRYGARVLAFVEGPGVDELIRDGQFIKAGDDLLEVIHTPGHSSDSICLFAPQAQAVFSGDTQLRIWGTGDDYSQEHLHGLEKLTARKVRFIFSGHDEPITEGVPEILQESVRLVKRSRAKSTDTMSESNPATTEDQGGV
jgi:glyoxylase-like metal-dependent hydrolase (beta-lactamase superfamily II)